MERNLEGKKVTVGVSGGIAAYKACSVVSALVQKGAEVSVVETRHATEFVPPLTFETLSKRKVAVDEFEGKNEEGFVPHIHLGQDTDVVLVAPATANIIGKAANGVADDLLSSTLVASTAPIVMVPSMNEAMYEANAVKRNIEALKKDGVQFVEPEEGYLACGVMGKGKFPKTEAILRKVEEVLLGVSDGVHAVVTSGGTSEPIDQVRKITNSGTGRLGSIVAEELAASKAVKKVTYIASKGAVLPKNNGKIEVVTIGSVEDLLSAVRKVLQDAPELFVHSMAVSDYTTDYVTTKERIIQEAYMGGMGPETRTLQDVLEAPMNPVDTSHKLSTYSYEDNLVVVLKKTPKVIGEIKKLSPSTMLVGFKLLDGVSDEELTRVGRELLKKNDCDYVVANDAVSVKSGEHRALLLTRDTEKEMIGKRDIARNIVSIAEAVYKNKA